jgi:nucleoid DNA-binding protein
MPLKEHLIKQLSLKLNIPEKILTSVINFQFTEALNATTLHNSIELSGFGKFVFSKTKAKKQMEKYESQVLAYTALINNPYSSEEVVRNNKLRLATTQKNIEHLKPKLTHEPKRNLRRGSL